MEPSRSVLFAIVGIVLGGVPASDSDQFVWAGETAHVCVVRAEAYQPEGMGRKTFRAASERGVHLAIDHLTGVSSGLVGGAFLNLMTMAAVTGLNNRGLAVGVVASGGLFRRVVPMQVDALGSASVLLKKAQGALASGDLETAVQLFTAVLERLEITASKAQVFDPDGIVSLSLYYRAVCYDRLNKPSLAREDLKRLFEVAPQFVADLTLVRDSFVTLYRAAQTETVATIRMWNVPTDATVSFDGVDIPDLERPILARPGRHLIEVRSGLGPTVRREMDLSAGEFLVDVGRNAASSAMDQPVLDAAPSVRGMRQDSRTSTSYTQWFVEHTHRGILVLEPSCYGVLYVRGNHLGFRSLSDPPEGFEEPFASLKAMRKKGIGRGRLFVELSDGTDWNFQPESITPTRLATDIGSLRPRK